MSYATYGTMYNGGKTEDEPEPTNPTVVKVQSDDHRTELVSQNTVVVIDYYADWCGPCKHVTPQFEELSKKWSGIPKLIFAKEDVDDQMEHPPVNGVPCFHFFVKGNNIPDLMILGGDLTDVEKHLMNLFNQKD